MHTACTGLSLPSLVNCCCDFYIVHGVWNMSFSRSKTIVIYTTCTPKRKVAYFIVATFILLLLSATKGKCCELLQYDIKSNLSDQWHTCESSPSQCECTGVHLYCRRQRISTPTHIQTTFTTATDWWEH